MAATLISPSNKSAGASTMAADLPTRPIELNHLEAMGICMSLRGEEMRDGLSEPQKDALIKVQDVLSKLLDDLGRPA